VVTAFCSRGSSVVVSGVARVDAVIILTYCCAAQSSHGVVVLAQLR